MVAHHTVNGCNLQPGDLLGSGTLSGAGAGEAGSLMELTQGGKEPLRCRAARRAAFLEDGDEVTCAADAKGGVWRRLGSAAAAAWCAPRLQSGNSRFPKARRADTAPAYRARSKGGCVTPQQIDLVQASWKQAVPVAETAAQMFYGRLSSSTRRCGRCSSAICGSRDAR